MKFGNKFRSKNPVFEVKTGILGSKTGVLNIPNFLKITKK